MASQNESASYTLDSSPQWDKRTSGRDISQSEAEKKGNFPSFASTSHVFVTWVIAKSDSDSSYLSVKLFQNFDFI